MEVVEADRYKYDGTAIYPPALVFFGFQMRNYAAGALHVLRQLKLFLTPISVEEASALPIHPALR